ncbi:MAG: PEGA domain-containing protein [Deltaproteobacteria bacterium]|nr:PEGA domain-containing protein [Deltaproteobacteria bacterium]
MQRVLVLAAALVGLVPAVAQAEQRIAVLETTVEGGADPVVGSQVTARLAEVLGARPGVKVMAPDDIRALLEQEANLQMMGCDDDSCLAEIGGALGADLLVKSRVTKLEKAFAVSLSAVDPNRAAAVGRSSQTWGGESIALLELVSAMVEVVLPEAPGPVVGAIELTGAEEGSQILVDDQVRGTVPAGQMGNIPVGGHLVRVVKDGYKPAERWVVVRRGRTTTVAAQQEALESKPFYATWWFWTIAGVAVAGAAAGTAVALSSGSDSATGVNVSANADSAFTGGR